MITPETFAAIASQVFSADMLPYGSPVPTAPILALPSEPIWAGSHTVEYVTYSAAAHTVSVQTSAGEFDRDSSDTDNDTLTRAMSVACKRIEAALTALIAV